jgi:hypothetical protein
VLLTLATAAPEGFAASAAAGLADALRGAAPEGLPAASAGAAAGLPGLALPPLTRAARRQTLAITEEPTAPELGSQGSGVEVAEWNTSDVLP